MTALSAIRLLQPYDATLAALAALDGTGGNKSPYFTAFDALAMATLTSQARSLLDDTSFDAMLATLGLSADAIALVKAANDSAIRTELGLGDVAIRDIGTVSQIWLNTANRILAVDKMWGAADPVTLTYASSYTPDLSTFINGVMTLTGNITINNPSNVKKGQKGAIELIQDGTGSRTAAWGSEFVFAGGTDIVLSTAAAARDVIYYDVLDDNKVLVSAVKDVKN